MCTDFPLKHSKLENVSSESFQGLDVNTVAIVLYWNYWLLGAILDFWIRLKEFLLAL